VICASILDETPTIYGGCCLREKVIMSHQTGTITSFDQDTGVGYLTCNQGKRRSVYFNACQVDELTQLVAGEPVSYELIQERKQAHAEHIQRLLSNLEAYQHLGGLYS
jgi:cold shock CspA family protein